MRIVVDRVHPVTKKMMETRRYDTTVDLVGCCEDGTWTWEANRMRRSMVIRNHWSKRWCMINLGHVSSSGRLHLECIYV
jgi:hypothetical protein